MKQLCIGFISILEKLDCSNSIVAKVVIECLVRDALPQQVFGNHQGSLKWLAISSGDVVVFTRKTLANLDA